MKWQDQRADRGEARLSVKPPKETSDKATRQDNYSNAERAPKLTVILSFDKRSPTQDITLRGSNAANSSFAARRDRNDR